MHAVVCRWNGSFNKVTAIWIGGRAWELIRFRNHLWKPLDGLPHCAATATVVSSSFISYLCKVERILLPKTWQTFYLWVAICQDYLIWQRIPSIIHMCVCVCFSGCVCPCIRCSAMTHGAFVCVSVRKRSSNWLGCSIDTINEEKRKYSDGFLLFLAWSLSRKMLANLTKAIPMGIPLNMYFDSPINAVIRHHRF